ncbi:efflux RND transporter periplasmic adaptor subunit [uncultured Ramlibacter sp.]|uniref:efflux RND transporter periplasmic adaptor subunit n=1 Tax=uncultured Ramlibacter sp. TaxID=260755 RepID=UPI002627BA5E|nr:efflux RND transporter periplasmic adaptor subunit [uncultured Ramlibacter sp.]
MPTQPLSSFARLVLLAAASASALVLSACSRPEPAQEPVRAVKVLTVGTSGFQSATEFAAEVRPRVESRLGFRVGGKITRRQAELGQRVKAGEVLAQLDPQDYQLAAEVARAQLTAATTNLELAAADFKRYTQLKNQNFISGAELERRETTLKSAQAQFDQARAQLSSQGNQARYTSLVADVSGVVTAIEAEPGQVVSAGAPVVRIAQDGPRDVVFAVPEDKVVAIKPGSEVSVRLWSENRTLSGKVREVAASADPVTRTYAVKVGLDGAAPPPLGATVYVAPQVFSHAGAQVIKLPTSALRQEGGATAVWVLDKASMTLKSQPVQIATADGNEAVVAAGLQPGQLVVVAGVHVLSAGQKVTIYQGKQVVAPANPGPDATKTVATTTPAPAK